MDPNANQAHPKRHLGNAATDRRPPSRAREVASRGLGSAEAQFRLALACCEDILEGALSARKANAVARQTTVAIAVAKNADALQAMHDRAEMQSREADADSAEQQRRARVAELERELAFLKS